MENPLVSVVIPTYNRAEYAKKAIESVLSQTYKNVEIFVVDGSPNNETEKMLQLYSAGSKIIYIHRNEIHDGTEKDKGNLAQSRNQAIKAAKGKYIATLDDDDFWSNETKLEKQVRFLEDNPDYVACGGGSIVILEINFQKEPSVIFPPFPQEKNEDIKRRMFFEFISYISSICYRKTAWEAVGGYDETQYLNEDWDFPFKLGMTGKLYNFQEYFITTLMGRQNKANIEKFARKKMRYGILLIKKYQKYYPGASKAILYARLYYIYYCLPFSLQRILEPIRGKIKRMIFPIVEKIYRL